MASNLITKEIESRLKQSPEHLFEVFLEIHQPIKNEAPEILIKYPESYSDEILKTAAKFAYPCSNLSDDLNENYTFVILDCTGAIFRFGFCRRSNREMTCLCLLSYHPWFEMFYHILNDLSQMINSKSGMEVECFLSALYECKLMSNEEFSSRQGKELILEKYSRPDLRQLPVIPSNLNFSVLFSQLNCNAIMQLFVHLLFERRILFVSSKLFHLSACACACLDLINPMHWQNLFLPILPESMSWTVQCTAPYIIGIHSSVYSRLNARDLEDVVVVHLEKNLIHTPHDDLKKFPKSLLRQMKKELEENLQRTGDYLARVFLRIMAAIFGNYSNGFVIKDNRLDFSRDVYLRGFQGTEHDSFMSTIVDTQMFEQFSRYRASLQAEGDLNIDEFQIEVSHLPQPKVVPIKQPIPSQQSLIDTNSDDIALLPPPLVSPTVQFDSPKNENENNHNHNNNSIDDLQNLIDQFDPLHS